MDKLTTSEPSSEEHRSLGPPSSNGQASTGDDAGLSLGAVWETIWRTKWLILGTCLLVTGAVTGYTLSLPEIYESTSIVSVDSEEAERIEGYGTVSAGGGLSKEVGMFENSSELNERVVERLSTLAEENPDTDFTIFREEDGTEVPPLKVMSRLQDRTDFEPLPDKSLIRIVVQSESPKEATFIANAYAEEYESFTQEMARAGIVAARKFLEKQAEKRKEEIENIEQEWAAFARSNNVVTDGQGGERVAAEYNELQRKRDEAQFQLEQEQRMKSVLEEQLNTIRPNLRASVKAEQETESLRSQIQSLEKELASLRMQAGRYYMNDSSLRGNEERIPELADLKRRIDATEERKAELTEELVAITEEQGARSSGSGDLGGSVMGQVSTLQSRIDERALNIQQLKAQIKGYERKIAASRGQVETIPGQTIRREQIQRRLEQAEKFYDEISSELQRVRLKEESEAGYVQIVRSAVVPSTPTSPNLIQNIILGILLGLGFGIGLGFLTQSTNTLIYEPEDLEGNGYNLLGVVPMMDRMIKEELGGKDTVEVGGRTISTRLFPLLNPWSVVTENYRLLRTNLQYPDGRTGKRTHPQVISVSSPKPSDGKTTTVVNLAITFAMSGSNVLLVDADLRKPTTHHLLGLNRSPGLTDVLRGTKSFHSVKQTFVEGLFYLSAGKTDVPPAEILDNEGLPTLIGELRDQFDTILIDTPPVLAVGDALIIAVQADANLVVADAGSTDRQALDQVQRRFNAVGVDLSAVILNRYDVKDDEYGYGYSTEYTEYNSEVSIAAHE